MSTITDRDIVVRGVAGDKELAEARVGDLMTKMLMFVMKIRALMRLYGR